MEIEAKFAVQDVEVHRKLQAVNRLGQFTISRGSVQEFIDTYYDTEDRRILDVGFACRIRQYPGNTVATLKELFSFSDDGVHRREEYETYLPPATTLEQPVEWPESDVRHYLLDLTKGAPLLPLFSFSQRRTSRDVRSDERKVAELALDTVMLPYHDQTCYEVEVELTQAGTEANLAAIAAHLRDIQGLTPEPRSKFERILALPAPDTSVVLHVNGPGITLDDTMAEATRKILRYYFQRMESNEPGTRIGEDIEALHDMRVATRRMRTAFRVLSGYIDAETTAPYRKDLRRTGRVLGAVRDMDVFREKAEAYLDTLEADDQPNLVLLKTVWDGEYELARARMLKHLDSRKFAQFKTQFGAYLDTSIVSDSTPTVRKTLAKLIQQRADDLHTCKMRLDVPQCTFADYHQLRIEAKRLRYTLEYFREVLSPAGQRAIDDVRILQNHLGALQDAVVASVHIRYVVAYGAWRPPKEQHLRWLNSPMEALGVREYLDFQVEEIDRLTRTFPDIWERYQGPSFRQLINNAVTALSSK